MENEGYIRSNIRLIIFTILTTLFVLFSVLAIFFYIYIDDSSDSSAVEEEEILVPLIDKDNILSEETITYFENDIIPTVSEVFEYEEVIFEYDESSNRINFIFVTTADSFGIAVTELLEAKSKGGFDREESEHYQRVVYYEIIEGMEEAFEEMQNGFDEEVSFRFATPNMGKADFMTILDYGILASVFQEGLLFDVEPF